MRRRSSTAMPPNLVEYDHPNLYDLENRDFAPQGPFYLALVRQVYTEAAYRRWKGADGQEVTQYSPLAMRVFYPQELEALLHYNGFTVLERYGDYDRGPLTAESRTLIYVCRLRV
jgi:hypothetical protein